MKAFTGVEYVAIVKLAKEIGIDKDELARQIRRDRAEAARHRALWTIAGGGTLGSLGAITGAKTKYGPILGLPAAIAGEFLGYWLGGMANNIKQLRRKSGLSKIIPKGYVASPEEIRKNAIKDRLIASGVTGVFGANPFLGDVAGYVVGPKNPYSYINKYHK